MHVNTQLFRPKPRHSTSVPAAVSSQAAQPLARYFPAAMTTPAALAQAPQGAASGAVAPPQRAASGAVPLAAIRSLLQQAKEDHTSWHTILNYHASKRPKKHGGRLCRSLRDHQVFGRVGVLGAMHSCRLVLENSYAPEDGMVVRAECNAFTRRAADEYVCYDIFAQLCNSRDCLHKVVLRPAHWKVPIEALLADIGLLVNPWETYQPLAVHYSAGAATFAGALANVPEANLERTAELIRLCLRAHGDDFDPTAICHQKIVQEGGEQPRVSAQLARLIPKKTLRQFINQHPEFEYFVKSPGDRPRIRYAPAAYDNPPAAAPGALSAALSGALPNPPAASDSAAPGALSTVQTNPLVHYTNIHRMMALGKTHPLLSHVENPRDQQKNDGSLTAAASGASSYYPEPVDRDLRGEGGGEELTDFWIKGPGRLWPQWRGPRRS